MACDRGEVEAFLYSSLEKVKRNGEGWIARCPVCGDSKKSLSKRRLHIDYYSKYDEWVYTCYNGGCNASGNIQSLYVFINGVTYKEADDILNGRKYDPVKLKDKLDGKKTFVDEIDNKCITSLDLDLSVCYTLKDSPESLQGKKYINLLKQFVVRRRIPTKYNPMICFDGKYKNRFIIPVYDDDKLIYFQGRSIYDWIQPKYLNPDVIKEHVILNRDKFDRNKFIIITESLICAMNIGQQGTSCLGATISDNFLAEVFKYTNKGVIVALDNPRIDESGYKNYIKILEGSKYARKVRFFIPDTNLYKDINSICVDNDISFLSTLYEYVLERSYNDFKTNYLLKSMKTHIVSHK